MFLAVEHVEFDDFHDASKCAEKFKKSLVSLQDGVIKDSFFDAILYGLLFKFSENSMVSREKIRDILREEFSNKLISENCSLQLDDSFDSFFDKCHLVNDLLETKGLFLRVYERRDKFRYPIKKGVTGKNNVTQNLSSCVIQKFNGHEILKHQLKRQERQFLCANRHSLRTSE